MLSSKLCIHHSLSHVDKTIVTVSLEILICNVIGMARIIFAMMGIVYMYISNNLHDT